jgi:hypothetical protein
MKLNMNERAKIPFRKWLGVMVCMKNGVITTYLHNRFLICAFLFMALDCEICLYLGVVSLLMFHSLDL